MTNLQIRILTALIYFPLLLLSAYSPETFTWMMLLLTALAWHEYLEFRVKPKEQMEWSRHICMVFLGSLPIFVMAIYGDLMVGLIALGISLQLSILTAMVRGRNLEELWAQLQFYVFGVLYITGLFLSLVLLQREQGGREAVWFLFFVVGATDTIAYFTGKNLGHTPFFQWISPSKTREGFWGGLLGGVLSAVIFYFVFKYFDFSVPEIGILLGLVGIVSLASTWGDLFESLLKRHYKLKESGRSIPGHGGVLDRFDGVLFAGLPLLFLVLLLGGFKTVFH